MLVAGSANASVAADERRVGRAVLLRLFGRFLFLPSLGRLFLRFLAGFLGFAHDCAPLECLRMQSRFNIGYFFRR